MKQVVLDMDLSSDVGDVGGLAVALAYHRLGHIDIVGFVACVTNPHTPGCADALATHQGVTIPAFGAYKPAGSFDPGGPGTFAQAIYDENPHPNTGLSSATPDAVAVYESILTAAADNSVTIYAGGPFTTVDALLTAHPTLVADKVSELVAVAGLWPNSASVTAPNTMNPEWNIVQAKAEAGRVFANWPTPILIAGCELGDQFTVGNGVSTTLTSGDPRRRAYELAGYASAGRNAWDEIGMAALAESDSQFTVTRGTGSINISTGANTFTPSPEGTHRFLAFRASTTHYKAHLNALLMSSPSGDPITAWPSGGAAVVMQAST